MASSIAICWGWNIYEDLELGTRWQDQLGPRWTSLWGPSKWLSSGFLRHGGFREVTFLHRMAAGFPQNAKVEAARSS